MENTNCPICGETNPSTLENCQNCNRPLHQTAGELDGAEGLRDSKQTLDDIAPLDWLAGLDDDGDEEDEEAAEWLVELQGDRTEGEVAPDESITMGDVPCPSDENESSIKKDELSGEVSDLRGKLIEEGTAPATTTGDDGLPEWLSSIDSAGDAFAAVVEAENQKQESALGADDDLPDWMSNFQSDTVGESVEESAPVVASGSDTPDWLSSLSSEDFSAKDTSLAEDVFETEASLNESVPPAVSMVDTDEIEISDVVESDIPDWLSQMEKSTADSCVETKIEEVPAFFEEGAYDHLESLPSAETKGEEEGTPSTSSVFIGDDDSSNIKEDGTDEIFGIETPDWLSDLDPEDVDSDASVVADIAGADEDIGDAELPSWVQAMRPVASVISDTFDGSGEHIVAETGPLAGLSGVLGAGPGLGELSKPRAPSIKLQVSEDQQNNVAMLEGLLAGESEPRPFELQAETSSIPVLRWLIAVLLIFVVGSALFNKTDIIPSPNIIVPEIRDAIEAINQLPAEGSALVVFDYEAGFSGEMQAVAAPLVNHLMLRGEKLVLLSTTPMGPALAERFLIESQSGHGYLVGEDYLNLGYLSGGISGILGFISNPHMIAVAPIKDVSIWDLPPLVNVNRYSDFSVIVILTDDVEKGRAWIEQSTVALDGVETPFLMAISAQAEPIIYPYYASGQVDGLVSGLSGGATYERMLGQDGAGRKYWDSYSVGLLLAVVLIAIGAMANFLVALRARQKTQREEN